MAKRVMHGDTLSRAWQNTTPQLCMAKRVVHGKTRRAWQNTTRAWQNTTPQLCMAKRVVHGKTPHVHGKTPHHSRAWHNTTRWPWILDTQTF